LWYPALRHRLFPQHRTPLPPQRVPRLLVIIHHRVHEAALQFCQGHASRLRRRWRIMDTVAGLGQASFKALGHPPNEGLHRALCGWRIGGRLLGNDAKPIDQDLPGALGGEDLPAVMADQRWLANTGPGMRASSLEDHTLFALQAVLDQAQVVRLLERAERED